MKVSGTVHKNLVRWGVLVAVVALIGAGCSSSGGGKPNPQNVTDENLCDQWASIACYNMFTCCTQAQIDYLLTYNVGKILASNHTNTEATCRYDMKLVCENNYAAVLDSVADGKARVNPEKATACLQALVVANSDSCFVIPKDDTLATSFSENCEKSVEGLVSVGDECKGDYECVADATCETSVNEVIITLAINGTTRGKCVSKRAQGVECNYYYTNCKTGLYCATTTTGEVCSTLSNCQCATLKTDGSTCCNSSECATGSYCTRDPNLSCTLSPASNIGTCTALRALGAQCASSNQCDSGFCEIGICELDSTKTCETDGNCPSGGCIDRVCTLSSSTQNYCTLALNLFYN